MNKKIIICIFTMTVFFQIFAQDDEIKLSGTINYEQFIEVITNNVPKIKLNNNKITEKELEFKKAAGNYDVVFQSHTNTFGTKLYPDSDSLNGYIVGLNVNGMFYATLPSGTQVGLGANYRYNYLVNGTIEILDSEKDIVSISHDPVLKITVMQPLLMNWFGFLDRYTRKNAKMELELERLKQSVNNKIVMDAYRKLYFSWIVHIRILDQLQKSIENAKTLENQTIKKVQSGVAENDALQKVKYQLYKYQEQYKNTEMSYKMIINELSLYFDMKNLKPDMNDFNKYFSRFLDKEIAFIAFENTKESEILNLNRNQLNELKKAKFNQMLPQLNLQGTIDIRFHEFTKYLTGSDIEFNGSYGDVDFVAGIEFVFPLGNIKSRADYQQTQLMIENLILLYDDSKKHYTNNLKNIIENNRIMRENFIIKENIVGALKSQYQTENKKYLQARLDLFYLLETDNSITSEEIALLQLKNQLIDLYFDYLTLTD